MSLRSGPPFLDSQDEFLDHRGVQQFQYQSVTNLKFQQSWLWNLIRDPGRRRFKSSRSRAPRCAMLLRSLVASIVSQWRRHSPDDVHFCRVGLHERGQLISRDCRE